MKAPRHSNFVGSFLSIGLCAGGCFAQCNPEQVVLTGTTLGSGFGIGVNSSGNRTDWLTTEGSTDFLMLYPPGQAWGAVFVTVGQAVATNRPGIDLTNCKSLILELSGSPGTTISVGIKDSTQPDDGTEATKSL